MPKKLQRFFNYLNETLASKIGNRPFLEHFATALHTPIPFAIATR
jgi:hypothetical protein